MENLALLLVTIFLGIAFQRLSIFPKNTAITLNLFVIYISLPATILLQVPKLSFSSELLLPALLPWAIMGLSALLILFLSKMFKWNKSTTGSLMMVAVLGNTSFVGIPMVTTFYGAEFIPYAMIYDQLATFIAAATYGSFITAYYGKGGEANFKSIVKKIITFPPFISLNIAFLLMGVDYPPVVEKVLNGLSVTLVPLALAAVGFQLTFKIPKEDLQPFALAIIIKLIFSPFIAWFMIYLMGVEGKIAEVTIFEAGMAPMITAGAMAILADLSPRLTAAIVGIGILLSLLTLPVLYRIIS